eukprot:4967180-Prymnesium_polylepis.1
MNESDTRGAQQCATGTSTGCIAVITGAWALLTCGNNAKGQLALGDCVAVSVLKQVTLPEVVPAKLACDNGHLLVVSTAGQLFSCGSNSHGQLGLGEAGGEGYHSFLLPVDVVGGRRVVDISAAHDLSLIHISEPTRRS